MFNIGPMEVLVVLVVALVVLGPDRLPQAGRQLGKAMSELRRWSASLNTEVRTAFDPDAGAERTRPESHHSRGPLPDPGQ